MIHFAFAIYAIVFSVLSGVLMVGVILAGLSSWTSILIAMALGALLSLPATYKILKRMDWSQSDPKHEAKPDRWHIR